jgi:hypothetical protein
MIVWSTMQRWGLWTTISVTVHLSPVCWCYVASPEGRDSYVYELDGGLSWATPMLTGLAGMASQINGDLAHDALLQLLVHSIVTNEKGLTVIDFVSQGNLRIGPT